MSTTAELNDTKQNEQMDALINQAKTFVWHQIFGPSDQSSIDFYTKALDWGTTEFPVGDMGTYKMLTVNGSAVAGVIGTENCPDAANVPPHWSVSIAVDDVDARAAKCVSLGGTILQSAFDIPTVGRMVLLQDPQGATFWLFKPEGC
jgi:predicted enzyme related to lactoylglutathione lyase